MNVREHKDELVGRVQRLVGSLHALLLIVVAGFWTTQVVRGDHYRELAENNRLRKVPIKAPRGLIFDRGGNILVENVPSYDLTLDRTRAHDLAASVAYAARILGRAPADLEATLERVRSLPQFQPVTLAKNLSLSEVSRFGVASLEHPEFEVEIGHQRIYRQAGGTAHVLGYLGEVSEEDLKSAPEVYVPGDLVGRKGIEATYDKSLRGRDGERIVVVDSRGQALEEYGKKPAHPGKDLTLTLDLALQQEAERQLEGKVGAIVALDPRDGAIRALASSPSYDPNLFTRPLAADEWRTLIEGPNHPLQNRALQSRYSPGSVFKIVMAVAGISEGVINPSDTEFCGGAATFYDHRYRCWKQGGHGTVDLHRAIKYSCDVYFYHLGKRLGIERIARYARKFHLGRPSGIDIKGEKAGLVPDSAWSLAARKHPWYAGETISVAIGQGPLLVTPLQMAAMAAVVANGGRYATPHLVQGAEVPKPELLGLDPKAVALVRRGLWAVVNEGDGTGRQAQLPGIEVAGKTGTAQVVTQKTWTKNTELKVEHRDHAWFASFAPYDHPELVVVVFLEHAGAGSVNAAPVARALYEIFFASVDVQPGPTLVGG